MKLFIEEEKLDALKQWFSHYVQSFQGYQSKIRRNIDLKEQHTRRVVLEIIAIGKKLSLTRDELRLAEIIALLHDLGRFEQFARYQTFKDQASENHAALGITIIKKQGVLESFEPMYQDIILQAIKNHNQPYLPPDMTGPILFYSKLIRDADKLDIWRVVIEYYYRKNSPKNEALELDLPDTPGFSTEVMQDMLLKKNVSINHVKNLNDFKLLQMSWAFDINFQPTRETIQQRGYIEMLRGVLPASPDIDALLQTINSSLFQEPTLALETVRKW
ncbi:HD domain-containing protein [bacterium]|nr:HD domain-containing protein [bacterium]